MAQGAPRPSAWTASSVAAALGLADNNSAATFTAVSTDSRNTQEGDLFVALVGEHFDGHDYVQRALALGARGIVVSRAVQLPPEVGGAGDGLAVYQVPDTLVAYGALAHHRRNQLSARVVGITGSSGKTTTKDLTAGALGASLRTHATTANYNNRIGLPRTILEAPEDTEVLVLEMGTNEPGEIRTLTQIAGPEIGVVTTVSESHLEGLGSLQGILDEKLALLRGLPPTGVALVGESPEVLSAHARELAAEVRVAGLSGVADVDLRATDLSVGPNGAFRFRWQGQDVELRIPGEAAVVDALLALGVAQTLGVPLEAAARGVGSVEAGWLRGEVRHVDRLTLILDCYNANPQSVRAAVRTLERMPTEGQRVLVLGSMLELGAESDALHATVLAEAADAAIDVIYASGLFAAAPASGSVRVVSVPEVEALAERLVADLDGSETVLLKASRGVKLERVAPSLESAFATDEPNAASAGGTA